MTVTVRLFAILRERAGRGSVEIELPEGATVGDAFDQLAQPPVPVGYFDEVTPGENFERQKRFTPYTAMYNVTGQPAVNLPLYWTGSGLPIGVMVAAPMGGEGLLISLSAQVEAARRWKDRHPALW